MTSFKEFKERPGERKIKVERKVSVPRFPGGGEE